MGIKRSYFVQARWDEDAQVFWSDSDIKGLHIEAATLEEFENLVGELAPDLIFESRLRQDELAATRDSVSCAAHTQTRREHRLRCRKVFIAK